MAVKKGYKQTEVGVIPEDWTVTTVRDFAKIITGPFGTLLKASEYSDGNGVPLISVGEIREGYLSITHETPRVSSEVTRRLPQYVLKQGDIIFGRKGGVDRSALIRQNQAGWFLGSDGIALRPFGRLCHEYAALQFQSKRVQSWLLQHAIGTTMPSLNQTILSNVIIPIPPTLTEQEAIAGALSDADAWIESLEQLIAKKRQIKQGAMQELLTGKRRLPGFEVASGFKQTDVGEIPKNWTVTALGSICKIERGKFTARPRNDPKYYGGDIPFIQTGDVSNSSGLIRKYSQTLNELGLRVSKRFPAGTLFITIAANIGDLAITEFDTACPDSLVAISPAKTIDQRWLYHELKRNKSKFEVIASSNAQSNLNLEKITPFLIPLPPTLAEQTAIANVLSDMDTEIESLESKLAKAREIKQGMMQELLTGRIRLV